MITPSITPDQGAVQKAKETRALRGTNKGRKQKAHITGATPEPAGNGPAA